MITATYRILPAVTVALFMAKGVSASPATEFVNGQIYTPTGWARAMAVDGDHIVALGTVADVSAKAGAGARIVDLGGRTVLPGLADMHVHPLHAGFSARRCQIAQGVSGEQLLSTLADCVKAKKPGEWIIGGQWEAISLGKTPLTKETLDRVSPNNPVLLTDISGHSRWANSRALAIAGVSRDTPNPAGGIIERNAHGEPTGVLRESAATLVDSHVPRPTPEENASALKYALDTLLSQGVTSLADAIVLRETLVAYDTLADHGELKQRVLGCIAYKHAPDFEELVSHRQSFARPNFRPDCVKVFMDGVPTDSHTGAMVEPYADTRKSAPDRGLLLVPPAELNPAVTRWDKMGLVVKFHAAGDQAVRSALDAVEAARKSNGMGGPRHMIGHNTFITAADMPRAKALNATWEFSPYLWYPQPITDDITKAVGAERMKRV
ncbi:MAG TPA: amidohydrolase, partial [Steroidobacteraceae bacterium]|nr:amidohydrolase [Steroidobacteraceae bacterium]